MAWDDTKATGGTLAATEWNTHVTDQKTRGVVNAQENKAGSDCSGSDGTVSRVLTLANATLTKSGGLFVFKNGLFMHSADITVSHLAASSTVTFNVIVWDTDVIAVIYLT